LPADSDEASLVRSERGKPKNPCGQHSNESKSWETK
jgi:hypothetical protein